MTHRHKLPARRPNVTETMEHDRMVYAVTYGLRPEDATTVAEVFIRAEKPGTTLDAMCSDASVLASLALQSGVPASALARSCTRLSDGTTPASIIGAVMDRIVEGER